MTDHTLEVLVNADNDIVIEQTFTDVLKNGHITVSSMRFAMDIDGARELIEMLKEAIEIAEEEES